MAFGERMTKYTGWAKDSEQYRKMIDILETFYECVKDQVKAEYLSKYDSSHTNPCPYEYNFIMKSRMNILVIPAQQNQTFL